MKIISFLKTAELGSVMGKLALVVSKNLELDNSLIFAVSPKVFEVKKG